LHLEIQASEARVGALLVITIKKLLLEKAKYGYGITALVVHNVLV